jgi:hypothetical protein
MPRTYFATCDDHIVAWVGPEHDTYEEATKDADKHDKEKHGGASHASVINVERP